MYVKSAIYNMVQATRVPQPLMDSDTSARTLTSPWAGRRGHLLGDVLGLRSLHHCNVHCDAKRLDFGWPAML